MYRPIITLIMIIISASSLYAMEDDGNFSAIGPRVLEKKVKPTYSALTSRKSLINTALSVLGFRPQTGIITITVFNTLHNDEPMSYHIADSTKIADFKKTLAEQVGCEFYIAKERKGKDVFKGTKPDATLAQCKICCGDKLYVMPIKN